MRLLAAIHLDLITRPLLAALTRLDVWLCDYGNDDNLGEL